MLEFAAGTKVTLTFPHTYHGKELTVTDLQYQVMNSRGEVLINFTTPAGFDTAANSTSAEIPIEHNQTDDKVDIRQVNVHMITDEGTYKVTEYYKIVGDLTNLVVMTDSFMTFPEAVVTRVKMSDRLDYYDPLPDPIKATALENAYKAIAKLGFKSTNVSSKEAMYLTGMTEAQFRALPVDFVTALKRAQLLQADALVEHSPIQDKIKQGIISETIGESSMFFRQSGSIGSNRKYPGLDDKAFEVLSPYLFTSVTSAQIWRLARA